MLTGGKVGDDWEKVNFAANDLREQDGIDHTSQTHKDQILFQEFGRIVSRSFCPVALGGGQNAQRLIRCMLSAFPYFLQSIEWVSDDKTCS